LLAESAREGGIMRERERERESESERDRKRERERKMGTKKALTSSLSFGREQQLHMSFAR
jgi:hypothetical protein